MKTIIDLLEKKGAGLALTAEDFEGLDEATIKAFKNEDEGYLEQSLDVKEDIVCIILPAEDDDEGEGEEKPEDGDNTTIHQSTKYA